MEILRHRKDGTPVHAAIWAAPLFNEAGETAEIVAFVADTTLEKRLAEQLQQAQKMEAVGRLAGGIAHDFNNVLTAITGYCELALRKVRPDEPVRRHLEGIRAAADKATAFTRQVLSFSRKQKSSPRLVDLDDVAASVVSMLHPVIGEDIRVVHARSSALWPVHGRPQPAPAGALEPGGERPRRHAGRRRALHRDRQRRAARRLLGARARART